MSGPPARVAVLGGGFAGIYAASYLAAAELPEGAAEITLVSDRNYFTFTPLLAEVVGGALGREDVTLALPVLAAQRGFRFRQACVEGIDADRRVIETSLGPVPFDYAVVALGARPRYFGNEELERHSLPLTSVRDALAIRERLIRNAEAASRESDPERRQRLLTVCVAGAGPAGVEVAAEARHLLGSVLPRYYPADAEARIVILQGGVGILPGWNPELATAGLEILRRRGIEVHLETLVRGFDGRTVRASTGEREFAIEADTLIWTAGTAPGRIDWPADGTPVRRSGHLETDPYLRVAGSDRVFAAGDMAFREDERSGSPYPAVAPIAINQGIRAAGNIENSILGRDLEAYQAHHAGSIVSLGDGEALVDVLGWTVKGRAAWTMYRLAYLAKLVGTRNKIRVATSLALSRFFEPDISADREAAPATEPSPPATG
ncbi:MAG: NAD(P)/FAD-dependent oxidoreductase [Gemmatimonadota bacterium]|nr:NAD(P)/FAD-dependent oxidoreductase [Gemmatimonadota bacterium]